MSEDGEIDVESDGVPDGFEVKRKAALVTVFRFLHHACNSGSTISLWHAGRSPRQTRAPQRLRAEKEGSHKGLLSRSARLHPLSHGREGESTFLELSGRGRYEVYVCACAGLTCTHSQQSY